MNNHFSPPTLPLWAWFIVVVSVIVVIFLAPFLETWVDRYENSDGDNFNLARLENAPNAIVMIGSSLTHKAFYYDNVMSDRLKKFDTPVIRISRSSAHQKSYEPILPMIAAAHPRLVFIESEMLLVDRANFNTIQTRLRHLASWFYHSLKILSSDVRPTFQGNYGHKGYCAQMTQQAINKLGASELNQSQFTVLSEPITPAWQRFITEIKANGGEVIFLVMGRSSSASEALTESFRNDYLTALTAVKTHYPIEVWRFPGPFEQQNYCDLAHLNERGRAVFVDWFIAKLSEILDD